MEILGKNFWNVIFHLELLLSVVQGHKTLKVGVVSTDHNIMIVSIFNLQGIYQAVTEILIFTSSILSMGGHALMAMSRRYCPSYLLLALNKCST